MRGRCEGLNCWRVASETLKRAPGKLSRAHCVNACRDPPPSRDRLFEHTRGKRPVTGSAFRRAPPERPMRPRRHCACAEALGGLEIARVLPSSLFCIRCCRCSGQLRQSRSVSGAASPRATVCSRRARALPLSLIHAPYTHVACPRTITAPTRSNDAGSVALPFHPLRPSLPPCCTALHRVRMPPYQTRPRSRVRDARFLPISSSPSRCVPPLRGTGSCLDANPGGPHARGGRTSAATTTATAISAVAVAAFVPHRRADRPGRPVSPREEQLTEAGDGDAARKAAGARGCSAVA